MPGNTTAIKEVEERMGMDLKEGVSWDLEGKLGGEPPCPALLSAPFQILHQSQGQHPGTCQGWT